jgi:2,3-bisphosphoglycerate-dependent phosphoglycerate mutase
MQATRIIAVRHGETDWNLATRLQGHVDIGLNDKGRWQAQRLAQALAVREPITAIYSSDLQRAFDTAYAVAQATQAPLHTTTGLRERSFGAFEGLTYADIETQHPEDARRWRQRDPHWAPPQGESLLALRERVLSTAQAIAAQHLNEQIVLVAHGGVMDMLYRAAAGVDLQAPRTWNLGNAAANRVLWSSEGFSIVGWSDTSHLDDDAVLDETTA